MTRCADFAESWARDFPRPADGTNGTNASMVKRFAEDFGPLHLETITRVQAYAWAKNNPGAARYVRTMFADAVNAGVLEHNVFANLRIPSSNSRANTEIPTIDEVRALELASAPEIAGMVTVAAFTALRIGEQLALRPCDLIGDVLDVREQMGHRGVRKPLKNGAPPRRVLVCPEALEALRRLPRAPEERFWPFSRGFHYKLWNQARQAVGVDYDYHCLRHTAATRWIEAGASPRDVAAMLGHKNDTLVRELYTAHVDNDQAIERLRAIG